MTSTKIDPFTQKCIALLGKSKEEPELHTWLQELGVDPAKINPTTSNPKYIELKKQGIYLIFKKVNEAAILNNITFCTPVHDGYIEYQGELPFGLNFGMSANDVDAIVGVPEESPNEDFPTAKWIVGQSWFFVAYNDELTQIIDCSLQIAD